MQIFLDCYHNPNFKNGCYGNIHTGKYLTFLSNLSKLHRFSQNNIIEVFQSYLFYLAVIVIVTAKTQN
jgi:hypothetical protein